MIRNVVLLSQFPLKIFAHATSNFLTFVFTTKLLWPQFTLQITQQSVVERLSTNLRQLATERSSKNQDNVQCFLRKSSLNTHIHTRTQSFWIGIEGFWSGSDYGFAWLWQKGQSTGENHFDFDAWYLERWLFIFLNGFKIAVNIVYPQSRMCCRKLTSNYVDS